MHTKKVMQAIEPKLPGGFRDYLPEDMIPREVMFATIRSIFERFGFVPLDTPGIERTEILTGGDSNFKKQIYGVVSQGGDENELSLRFDLTVPLARVVAANSGTLKRPFKRYQMGKVWRGERQQAGRYREFVQCDADIVGSSRASADAEIIALMDATMRALGFSKFIIRVNNRKILNGLAPYADFEKEKTEAVLRTLDKLGKQTWEEVAKELADKKEAALGATQIERIQKFLEIKSSNYKKLLEEAAELMKGIPVAEEGIKELSEVVGYLERLGVSDNAWVIDLSVARGLGYYTGTIYETILTDLPQIGSVFSGGRYDNLISRFGGNDIPAVGTSIGVDRLFAAMEQLNLVKREKTITEVLFLNFDEAGERDVLKNTSALRETGINTEFFVGSEENLKGQLAYAVAMEIPVVCIIGTTESEKGTVMVKDMNARTQEEIKQEQLVEKIKEILKK